MLLSAVDKFLKHFRCLLKLNTLVYHLAFTVAKICKWQFPDLFTKDPWFEVSLSGKAIGLHGNSRRCQKWHSWHTPACQFDAWDGIGGETFRSL